MRKILLLSNNLKSTTTASEKTNCLKKGTRSLAKSKKDCKVKMRCLGKPLHSREAAKNNQQAVDKNNQAWHHLKVLDTIEIFLALWISPHS